MPTARRPLLESMPSSGRWRALAGEFPNLVVAAEDLQAWADGGYGKPDFTRALAAFRPEQGREDGRLHLAFFPMYKQNGSPDTCFEAVLVRVPWPDWIAELEATRYDNPKFVPVELVAATRGYDSECAVLFPEQVAVAERQPNNFGAIFCDRESARLRRVASAAADLLQINLPPDAARLLADVEASKQSYILWDLIHDRAHSHGDLPFDPFMVRQRAPYWMYSLEELRCDLTAFGEAVGARARGSRVRSQRPVRDPVRPAAALPDHRPARTQLRRARRAAAVRVSAPRRLPALDRQPPDVRVGAGRGRRAGAPRRGSGAVPGRDRPHQAAALGGCARPGRALRPAGDGVALGRGGA